MADAMATDLGIDVHVVSTTDGTTPIETQADQIFQQRGIGRESPTGGLLILLDPKLASARIEVGYALEGAMTDLHMSRLARDQLAPYVGYGSAGMAVMDVLQYLREQAFLEAARGNLALPEKSRALPEYLELPEISVRWSRRANRTHGPPRRCGPQETRSRRRAIAIRARGDTRRLG